MSVRSFCLIVLAMLLGACAAMPGKDPIQVTVADIESIPGGDLEFRMLVKLRVQNPNDSAVDFDGVYVKVDVLDKTLATGVSDQRGSVPRYGETIINVPVTVSTLRLVMHGIALFNGQPIDKVNYRLEGKLDGPGFGSHRFNATGVFGLPGADSPSTKP